MELKYIFWFMIALQMAAWGWFSLSGGKLVGKRFMIFSVGLMAGQIGGGLECLFAKEIVWGNFSAQVYFLAFTFYGAFAHWRLMKVETTNETPKEKT